MVSKTKTAQAQRPLLHFARFEFKYILPAQKRQEVEGDMRFFLEYDPFVADRPDHRYFVRSLYYDDPVYSAFHNKIDGLHSRSKFRLRTYSRELEETVPMFLEIKGRHNNLVFKHRASVNKDENDWAVLKNHQLSEILLKQTEASAVRDQFEYELLRKQLSPVALIDYQRRPYISKYDPSFRVTFDERLMATQTQCLFPGVRYSAKNIMAGYTVLEVKFRHHLPSWFHRIIQTHELRRVSISKICSGMETLGMAFDEH